LFQLVPSEKKKKKKEKINKKINKKFLGHPTQILQKKKQT